MMRITGEMLQEVFGYENDKAGRTWGTLENQMNWEERATALSRLVAEKAAPAAPTDLLKQLVTDMREEMRPGQAGANDYHDAWQVFGERIERALAGVPQEAGETVLPGGSYYIQSTPDPEHRTMAWQPNLAAASPQNADELATVLIKVAVDTFREGRKLGESQPELLDECISRMRAAASRFTLAAPQVREETIRADEARKWHLRRWGKVAYESHDCSTIANAEHPGFVDAFVAECKIIAELERAALAPRETEGAK
jgi:hypothetical protein